ncbi:MAG: hypothetical protein IKU34_02175 [Clostridia bacterium]|nr:hypothetical protein [Clostridia bacterium]
MLDELGLRLADKMTAAFARWYAPNRVRFKRSAIGFRLALIFGGIKRTAQLVFTQIAESDEEDGILQRILQDPIEPVDAPSLRQKLSVALWHADAFMAGKAFAYLLLMTMISACLLAGSGARSLAVMAAFFCMNWLAEAFAGDYEPVCGSVRQRYLTSVLLRAGAYLVLLLHYFIAYAANGLQINVVLQGAMIMTAIVHVICYIAFAAFNRRQHVFLRVLCGLLGIAPAMACAAGIALGASTAARETMVAASGFLCAAGAALAFLSWEIGTVGELSGGRLQYYRLWQNMTRIIGFFMMLLGAWMCAQ